MKKLIVLDIESTKFEEIDRKPIEFIFAVLLFQNRSKEIIKSKTDFDNRLVSFCKRNNGRNDNYVVYAHNLMFDFSFCMKPLLEAGFILKPIENGGKLISVKAGAYRTKQRKDKDGTMIQVREFDTYLEFRDSYALFQSSLKKLGQFVNLEKIEHDKNFSAELSQLDIEYCVRDCEIVLLALERFADFYGKEINETVELHKIPPTTASSAFRIFKKLHNELDNKGKNTCPWILTNEDKNNEFLERWYFGGRVELFDIRFVENVSYYDINSLYPSVMINNTFHRPPYYITNFDISHISNPKTIGFYANVDETNEIVPLIPCHHNSGLYFPAIKKYSFIFKEEYDYLLARGVPIECKITMFSDSLPEKPFAYLERFYEMKSKKDSMSYFYKILMNSTYGRFGIDQEKETCEILPLNKDLLNDPDVIVVDDPVFPYMKRNVLKTMKFDRNVVLSAKITALARLELTKWIHKLIDSGVSVYYCDTDSIVCQESDILPFDDKLLGAFKKEHAFRWFQGLGNKEYVGAISDSEFIVKAKGVHNADIQSIFDYHSESGVSQLNVSKIRTMLREGWLDMPRNIVMVKKSKTLYHKRLLLDKFSLPIRDFNDLPLIEQSNGIYIAKAIENLKRRLLK